MSEDGDYAATLLAGHFSEDINYRSRAPAQAGVQIEKVLLDAGVLRSTDVPLKNRPFH